ncbi:MAG: hypothetical protein Q8Q24_00095, partial [bacterium]|nr:hypothetical protein [bacterium]
MILLMSLTPLKFDLNKHCPTFSPFVTKHKKFTAALSSLYVAAVVLVPTVLASPASQTPPVTSAVSSIPKVTAFGSQRHVFSKKDGSLVAVWVSSSHQIMTASSSDGVNWQEASSPLVAESAENVAGALDQGDNLHLAYESQGKIFYRVVSKDGSVSKAVPLDISGLAHRPTLILENSSGLPAVAWSSESGVGRIRQSKIGFMKAKGETTDLKNWCNAKGDSCGLPAYISFSGSADALNQSFTRAILHPVLAQMPQSNDFYLYWSDNSRKGNETLKLVIAKKEGAGWDWGSVQNVDGVGEETFKNFTLAAVGDSGQNQVVIVYVGKDGSTKAVSYKADGGKSEISPSQNIGSQFSLASGEGKEFLFYRKDNGKIGLRQYNGAWSEELLETANDGGYPSAINGLINGKVPFIYTKPNGRVEFSSFTLAPAPTQTPEPTTEPTIAPTTIPTTPATSSATPN